MPPASSVHQLSAYRLAKHSGHAFFIENHARSMHRAVRGTHYAVLHTVLPLGLLQSLSQTLFRRRRPGKYMFKRAPHGPIT